MAESSSKMKVETIARARSMATTPEADSPPTSTSGKISAGNLKSCAMIFAEMQNYPNIHLLKICLIGSQHNSLEVFIIKITKLKCV